MPSTNRDELLAVAVKEFEKLTKLLDRVAAGAAMAKDDDDTSIKDVVAHRAHWIGLFLGWYHDGMAGQIVHFPAPGFKWSELKRYNAMLRAEQTGLGWTAACDDLRHAHGLLIDFIEQHGDVELYGGPMAGANNQWTPGRWAEAAGPSHYRSAAKYIRARLKT